MSFTTQSGNGFVQLTLDRPPMNALDFETVVQLGDWFQAYSAGLPLILTGAGRAFSAGVDTKAFAAYSDGRRDEFFTAITSMTRALCSIKSPVVAALNGHALGGGLVIALCADYRMCVTGPHKFGLTEAAAGVPFPKGPIEIIKREVPAALLRNLTLSSRVVGADLLIKHCVFDELIPPEQLVSSAQERALELHAQPAFQEVKAQVRGPLIRRLEGLS